MTSVIVSSLRSGSSGPKPGDSSISSSTSRTRSSRVTAKPFARDHPVDDPLDLGPRARSAVTSSSVSKALMTSPWSRTRISRSSSSRAAFERRLTAGVDGGAGTADGARAAPDGGGRGGVGRGCLARARRPAARAPPVRSSDMSGPPSVAGRDASAALERSVPAGRTSARGPGTGEHTRWHRSVRGRHRSATQARPTRGRRVRGGAHAGGGWPWYTPPLRRGAIAQLGERLNGIQKVRGSSPLSSTNAR